MATGIYETGIATQQAVC